MVITQYGRVELDPMRLPQAASMRTGLEDTFEARLQAATAAERPQPEPRAAAKKTTAAAPAAAAEPGPEAAEERPEAVADGAEAATVTTTAQPSMPEEAGGEATQHTVRGEAGRRIEAGKGPTSPLASAGAPALPGAPPAAVANGSGGPVLPTQAAAVAAAATPSGTASTSVRGPAEAAPAAKALPPRPVAASYRTLNQQSVELLEQARDSVFKQILLKLGKDGSGEMRMRLEPPDLGELDLHLQVDKQGQLRLSIGAERSDLQQLLQRHLGELEQTLRQHGFAVTHTEVRTQADGRGGRGDRSEAASAGGAAIDEGEPAAAPAPQGFITAQGLDFWV